MRPSGLMRTRGQAAWVVVTTLLAAPAASACSTVAAKPAPARSFAAMQMAGPHTSPVLGPVTGTGPRTFTITARHLLSYQVGCLGRRLVWLRTTPTIMGFAVQCYDGGGVFAGESSTTPRDEEGARITVHVDAPPGTTWLLRVDGSRG